MSIHKGEFEVTEDILERINRGKNTQVRHNVKAGSSQPCPIRYRSLCQKSHRTWLRGGTNADGTCFYHAVGYAINYKGYWTKTAQQQKRLGVEFRRVIFDNTSKAAWERFWQKKGVDMAAVPDVEQIREQISESQNVGRRVQHTVRV